MGMLGGTGDYGWYSQVETFADLPAASSAALQIYLVRTTTGSFFNKKRSGLYRSDGASWIRLGVLDDMVKSSASSGADNRVVKSDGTEGKGVQESGVSLDDNNNFSGVASVAYTEAAAPGTPSSGSVVLYAKTDGLLYSMDDAGTETPVSGGGGADGSNKITVGSTGQHHSPQFISYTTGGFGTADTLMYQPFYAPANVTVTRIGVEITSVSGLLGSDDLRLGIYQAGSDGLPGSLVLDAGTIALTTAGVGLAEITISQALTAGTMYYLVGTCDTAASNFRAGAGRVGAMIGWHNDISTGVGGFCMQSTTTGAENADSALPSTAPAVQLVAINQPIIYVRVV